MVKQRSMSMSKKATWIALLASCCAYRRDISATRILTKTLVESNASSSQEVAGWPFGGDEPKWIGYLRTAFQVFSELDHFSASVGPYSAHVNIRGLKVQLPNYLEDDSEGEPSVMKIGEIKLDFDTEMAIATFLSRTLGFSLGAPTVFKLRLAEVAGVEVNLPHYKPLECLVNQLSGAKTKQLVCAGLKKSKKKNKNKSPPPAIAPPCQAKDPFHASSVVFGEEVDVRERIRHYVVKLAALKDSDDAEYIRRQKVKLEWFLQVFNEECDKGPDGEFDIMNQVIVSTIRLADATITTGQGVIKLGMLDVEHVKTGENVKRFWKFKDVKDALDIDSSTIPSLASFLMASLGQTILAHVR